MVVLNPLLFWGLAAMVAVPIVLHLIMRQSPKHVLFPALRFLQQRREANRRRLRLRHLVLLALRTAVLLFLAAALCRPSMSCSAIKQTKDAPVSAALVVDTSPSMDYEWQNQTRLKAAQETAAWLLTKLPDESQVAVLDSENAVAAFEIDLVRAKERLGQLQTTNAPDRLLSVAARAVELLESGKHEAKELYIFSDLSRGEWSPENAARLRERLSQLKSLGVYVIDVGAPEPQNTALGDLRLSGQTVARNSTVQLEQTVTRTGGDFATQLDVTLKDGAGNDVPQNPAQVTLKANESVVMPITLTGLREPGIYQGKIEIANREANQLSADDARYFTIEVRPPWKLLLAAPSPAEAYAWDLRDYLEPKKQRDENRQRFACDVKELSDLPRTRLADYAAVCLLDPPPLEKAVWEQLAAYANAGGSVAIFLGRNAEAESFNEPAAQALLPAKLSATVVWRESPDGSNRVYLNPAPTGHPMLAYFGRLKEPLSWDAFWIRQAWELQELPKDVQVVVPFTNQKPALLERSLGQGRVMLMTTPVSDDPGDESAWNNLFGDGFKNSALVPPQPFIALANEMLLYLVGASGEELNYVAGQTARIGLKAGQKVERYKLTRPLGEEKFDSVAPDAQAVVIGPLKELGGFRISDKPTGLDRGFSVNLSPQESVLTRVGQQDLQGIFAEAPFSLARDRDEINRQLTETRVGHDLFPLLIALAALILAAEHLLANRFYQETEPTNPAAGGHPTSDLVAEATT